MQVHSNAKTNVFQRRQIVGSSQSRRHWASHFGVAVSTVQRWKHRIEPQDRSSRPHKVRSGLSSEAQAVALDLRSRGLVLDDCVDTLKTQFEGVTRSNVYRLFARNKVGNLRAQAQSTPGTFKDYEPGFLHIDCTYLPALEGKRYLFVAIDRATRMVFVQVTPNKSMRSAHAFLRGALEYFPFKVHRILTDNGVEFTHRFWKRRARGPKKAHLFEAECKARGISHRLTLPATPKTNGMVERFNRLIKDRTIRVVKYLDVDHMDTDLRRWCVFYNRYRPHGGIGRITPLHKAHSWYNLKPEIFTREPDCPMPRPFATY
jgi:transposase InsO family protein